MVKTVNAVGTAETFDLDLRRGALVIAVLSQLHEEQYGYSLKKALGDRGLEIEEGTLYPLLRRLETQGLLESKWKVEGARPRRYYVLNAYGAKVLEELTANWRTLVRSMERLLKN
jgi:PadR family transcriptional regulator, regulatory protein PadR